MSAELRLTDNYDIVNSISNGVIATDINGRILFLNRAAGEIHHLHTPPLQSGGLLLDSVSHQWKEIVKNLIDTTRIAKASSSLEAVYTVDGKKVFYDITCSPILTNDGDVGRIIFEFRDITLQKIYENKIGFVAHDLTRLIETANALITIIDTRGFIVEWNDRAADITGYPKSEALAEHFSDLLLDSESKEIFDQIFSESIGGALITNKELPIWTDNRQRLNLLVNASCRKNSDRKVVGILLIGQNITELTDYRNALEEKVRDRTIALERALAKERELVEVKKKFVDIASHEFRAPISVISAQTRALQECAALRSDPEALARLEKICKQAEHMAVLLEDVLLLGKGDAGKISAKLEHIELKPVLESIITDVKQATHNTHEIKFTFPSVSLFIESDEKILRNIFVNLLTNAIKFSPGKDHVLFDIKYDGRVIQLKVEDQGIGISDEDIDKVFQPFNRASNAKDIMGTGLGLSIVKKAVEILNGRLSVESTLNVGSKFTVQLYPNHRRP